jgi:glycosyltransferase involved in cell wall biosynthesis
MWRWLNRRAYEGSEVVVTLGEAMAANLSHQFDARQTQHGAIEVVYPWADTEAIRPLPKAENWFAREHSQVGKLTVMYSGNMGLGHDIETMLSAAKQLHDLPDVHFLFIGDGPKRQTVAAAICDDELSNVTLLPWQPEAVLPFSLATGDLALVSLERGIEGLAVPSKAIYAMAAGSVPIVLSTGRNELVTWITTFGAGLAVSSAAADLVQVILMIRHDAEKIDLLGQSSRQAAETWFSRRANASQIVRFVETLVCPCEPP